MVDLIDRVRLLDRFEESYNDILIWNDDDDWNRGIKEGLYIAIGILNAQPTVLEMDELITRQEAIDAVESITSSMSVCINTDECHGMKRMQRQAVLELANLPSAQPKRKVGHWVPIDDEPHEDYECDVCGYISEATFGPGGVNGNLYNYCPNCGAEMDGEE